eukprot:scaffold77606_cov31-Tisochrysis_lutea.AAC.2
MDNLGIQEHGNLPRTAPRSGGSSERAGRADLYCAGTLFALDELCLTTVVAVVEDLRSKLNLEHECGVGWRIEFGEPKPIVPWLGRDERAAEPRMSVMLSHCPCERGERKARAHLHGAVCMRRKVAATHVPVDEQMRVEPARLPISV